MSSKEKKPKDKPPVEEKAPEVATAGEVGPIEEEEVQEPLTLEKITEALGTMEDARKERKILQDRAAAAKALEEEEKSLADAQTSQIRRAESKSRYSKAQADLLKNERLLAEEQQLKAKRDAEKKDQSEREAVEENKHQVAAALEVEELSKAFRDAGAYEPLKGEQMPGGVFLERSALDIGSVGVILRIAPLEKKGGAPAGVPQHLFIPNVKPSNGLLRRSIR